METLLEYLRKEYPHLTFTESSSFYWAPQTRQVFYSHRDAPDDTWSLLHELAHAILNHSTYSLDIELLRIEVEAWETAKELAEKYGVVVDDDHIQECLDSYRDWLHKRSVCPSCSVRTLQQQESTPPMYQCFNCHAQWQVAPSRFCRPYRYSEQNKESSATLITDDSINVNSVA